MDQRQRTEDAIADPSRQFKRPADVLSDDSLDLAAKRQILESWKKDALLLSTATNENMAGNETVAPLLEEVTMALDKLERLSGSLN